MMPPKIQEVAVFKQVIGKHEFILLAGFQEIEEFETEGTEQ